MSSDVMTNRLWSDDDDIFGRPDTEKEDAKSVIFISAEGKCTEPDYFCRLYERLREDHPDMKFAIEVLRHDGDSGSDPKSVFRLLEECRLVREDAFLFESTMKKLETQYTEDKVYEYFNCPENFTDEEKASFRSDLMQAGINVDYYRYLKKVGEEREDDIFAIVLDRDGRSHTKDALKEICSKARSKGYLFCLTNPCFEFWLLLHLVDISQTLTKGDYDKFIDNKKLSKKHTYCSKCLSEIAHHDKSIVKSRFDELYYPNIGLALERVRVFETSENGVIDRVGSSLPGLFDEIQRKLVS